MFLHFKHILSTFTYQGANQIIDIGKSFSSNNLVLSLLLLKLLKNEDRHIYIYITLVRAFLLQYEIGCIIFALPTIWLSNTFPRVYTFSIPEKRKCSPFLHENTTQNLGPIQMCKYRAENILQHVILLPFTATPSITV